MTAYTVAAKRRAKAAQKALQAVRAISGVQIAAGKDAPVVPAPKPAEPTEQRKAKGAMRKGVVKGPTGDTSVWIDDRPTPLRDCLESGKLALRLVEAGERFEELSNAVQKASGGRSCLDVSIRGTGESETERAARLFAEWKDVVQRMGMIRSRVVMSVAVLHEPTGDRRMKAKRFRLLVEGLTECADFWIIPEQEAA